MGLEDLVIWGRVLNRSQLCTIHGGIWEGPKWHGSLGFTNVFINRLRAALVV
jgi:hypothetical protein